MINKCINIACYNEDNETDSTKDWCSDCEQISRVQVMPPKAEYNHDFIFQKYLDDKCPVCDAKVDCDSFHSHTEAGGKCMAKYFQCSKCFSEYTIGYNRRYDPISSEVTLNRVC